MGVDSSENELACLEVKILLNNIFYNFFTIFLQFLSLSIFS